MAWQRTQGHLSRWLIGYALAAMGLGLAIGHPLSSWTGTHSEAIKDLTTVAVFLIIYPMMVNVRLDALAKAGRNIRGLSLAVAYNFVWAPLVGYVLARLFLHDPMLALGFLLVMVVPCSSMSIAYTGLAEGDIELATVIVAASFVLATVAVPAWMSVFAANYAVPVPLRDMLVSILEVLIAPMVLGYLTRRWVIRSRGQESLKEAQPVLASASMLAMFLIVFLIFFAKADMIVAKWGTVLLLMVPNIAFIGLTLAVATWLDRRLGLGYRDHMAIVFASTGKNNGTAIAIATMAFSPMVAIPAATMPIFQVMLLVLYLKTAGWLRGYFGEPRGSLTAAR
jgi:ACR3 family arsenite efflux pump ArsB